MADKLKSKEKKERSKSNLLKLASSSVAMANDPDEHAPSLEALQNMQDTILETINTRFDLVDEKLGSLQSSHNTLVTRIDVMDETVSDHETRLMSAENAISELRKENASLKAKANDLEGRSRRNNVKFIGIPEGEEKGRPTEFVSALIPKLLGDSNFSKPVVVDRAHRSLQPKPAEGGPGPTPRPRTIIARIHHYQEKEAIIRLARQHPLKYGDHKVFIFPDYTAEVMEQRRGFRDAMAVLRELKVKHSLRFPARLYFQHNGLQKVFTSPEEAMMFVGNLQRGTGGD